MINSIQTEIVDRFIKNETDDSGRESFYSNETDYSLSASERRFRSETRSFGSESSTASDSEIGWAGSFQREFSKAYLEGRFGDAIALIDRIDREAILEEIVQRLKARFESDLMQEFHEFETEADISQLQALREAYWAYFNAGIDHIQAEINQGLDYSKACCCALLGKTQEALELYSHLEGVGNHPLSDDVLLSGGLFYLQNGDLEQAAAEFQKIEVLGSDEILILSLVGQKLGKNFFPRTDNDCLCDSLMQAGQYREAIFEMNRVIDGFKELYLLPDLYRESQAFYLARIGFCHAMLGEWEECYAKIKEAADFDFSPEVVFTQAIVALLEGDWNGAEVAEKHRLDLFSDCEYEPHLPLLLTINLLKR